jgi:hypothetical protein
MITIEGARIKNLIYNFISNDSNKNDFNENEFKFEGESDSIIEEEEVLKKIFLKPFLSHYATFEFKHDISIDLNPLYTFVQHLRNGDNFVEQSKKICQHLKTVSKHPNIKDGDLFVVKYDGVKLNGNHYEALGIYKIETKESFIETTNYNIINNGLTFKKGIGTRRLDKACLILFTDELFTVLVIDNAKIETDYWQNDFLNLALKKDYINSTSQFLNLTKSFVTDQLPNDFDITKANQIDLLKRSVDYFKTHENFDKDEFEVEVLQDKDVIKSFRKFDDVYREQNDLEIADDFQISQQAVKKQARVFKSVLKLDKNFHIYIHGDRDLIEQGVEKDGRKYYKIYYQDES